ncbi:isoleucine--tRNA ligase [Candidatus Saccharibacteria bacterium]|nr:isoleucine--tRNA ligase [Candidatus Saccharibacteria bacterium]
MKYQANTRRRALEYEKALIEFWKKNQTFEKSIEQRDIDNSYVFYDGPPFITGMPHHGTLLSSVTKDAVPRFWTMRGKRVERRWGWDCHGLPAENFVEKQLGITDRREIGTKWPLATYIEKAKASMVANSEAWESTIERIGRWVDFRGAYRTMDKNYMESVWWAFKTLYEKGLIFEGRKVLMYDTKFSTPVSKAEVTMDNDAYQEVTDPSVFVKFKVVSEGELQGAYLLAWTTTPWTLPANLALAVNEKLTYGLYRVGEEKIVTLVKTAAEVFEGEYELLKELSGAELVGLEYQPLMENFSREERQKDTYHVLTAEYVSDEDGTGIVHIAPAYGEVDYDLALAHEVDFVDLLDEQGYYVETAEKWLMNLGVRKTDENGIELWAANKIIAKMLLEKGIVYRIKYIKHEYPFNPRSKQRIIYRAFPSWFFNVTDSKTMLISENEKINWFPEYLKHGRFEKNIEAAPDWNLSRDRFFATAMPVWKGDKGSVKVVGSYDELYELSGVKLEDYHRPWVDEIEFEIDGEHFKRIDKVLDCWFESGSMPFAQLHYPFENREKFEKNYPADFIVEYVGQVRAWFYYVHVVNTALFSDIAYKNVITTGTLAGNDGRKMSKSLGNYTDPNILMDQYSADSLRFLMLSSPVLAGEDFSLIDKDVSDVARKLSMIWNVFDFFTMYAEVDGFDSEQAMAVSEFVNPLDIWLVSRVHQIRNQITEGMEAYNIPAALSSVLEFIDDMSNWFVRRSRRRFWKSEDDRDKLEAYSTLYYVLIYLAKIMAPFTPFLAEELYQKMTGAGVVNSEIPESVHLLDWPEAGLIDEVVLTQMAKTREVITAGLAERMKKTETEAQIKVRQPLAKLVYAGERLDDFYEQIIMEEVNVKSVEHGEALALDKTLTPELLEEGKIRELIRFVQAARKKAGLNVDDRIKLMVSMEVPETYREMLMNEVLAEELVQEGNFGYDEIVKVQGENVAISLEKI